jgi:hypothetical protein
MKNKDGRTVDRKILVRNISPGWLSDFFLSFSLERSTNEQEITEETEIRHSPLFAPVQCFRFLSVFHQCSIRGSVLVAAEGRATFLGARCG